jgi:hypothetical protein
MSSLWLRASPWELRALRIVAGAVLNARDMHPGHPVDRKFARGVAKRAIGTLSSQWGDVLAASNRRPSVAERETRQDALRREAQCYQPRERGQAMLATRLPPVRLAIKAIAAEIGAARKSGQSTEKIEGMIECLRIIDRIVQEGSFQ